MSRFTKWEDEKIASVCGSSPIDKNFSLAINRLAELEDKIENGRIIELPCKIGDPIYIIVTKRWKRYLDPHSFILKTKLTYYNIQRVLSQLGKTIFLTKKEAEARMNELKEQNNDK